MHGAAHLTALSDLVRDIVSVTTHKKMIWINTRRIVTFVQDKMIIP
jgi:hypothetical protein